MDDISTKFILWKLMKISETIVNKIPLLNFPRKLCSRISDIAFWRSLLGWRQSDGGDPHSVGIIGARPQFSSYLKDEGVIRILQRPAKNSSKPVNRLDIIIALWIAIDHHHVLAREAVASGAGASDPLLPVLARLLCHPVMHYHLHPTNPEIEIHRNPHIQIFAIIVM